MLVKSKRGQVTLFIALGLMLLFSITILFWFKGVGKGYGEFKPYVQEVPVELQPLKRFIEQCVRDTTKEGLINLGAQGGYIYLDEIGLNKLDRGDPTSSQTVEFLPEIQVPYWYHMTSPNNCKQNCEIVGDSPGPPNDQSMQNDLARYVNENLQYCTRRFEQFPQFTITDSEPESQVNIGSSEVMINVLYELNVKGSSRTSEVNKFYTTIDLNLNKILDSARDIARVELQYQFLEYNDLELIATYSGLDSDLLPPFSATSMELKNIVWTTYDIKDRLQKMLQEKYMLLQAETALNSVRSPSIGTNYGATVEGIYDLMIVPFDNVDDFNVNFYYFEDWPIYLKLNNGAGYVTSETVLPTIIPIINFALERYKTSYDLSHPVVVELNDPTAFNNEGYNFRFGLESNVRLNQPLKFENEQEFVQVQEQSLICNLNQRNSGEIHLKVLDSVTNEAVDNVKVIFNSEDSCAMGSTNENGELTTNFPVAMGSLTLIKQDYLAFSKPLTTTLDEGQNLGILRMKPSIPKKVRARYYEVAKLGPNWLKSSYSKSLKDEQSIMVTFERIDPSLDVDDPEFVRYVIFDKDTEIQDVNLVTGNYKIDVMLIYDGNFIIPAKERCITYDDGPFDEDEKCFWLPGPDDLVAPMPPVQYSTTITVTNADLRSKTPITFYGLYINLPENNNLLIDDMEILNDAGLIYGPELEPKK